MPGQYADAHDLDSDLDDPVESGDEKEFIVRAKDLNTIGRENEMAPLSLPSDPKVVRLAESRRKERKEAKRKLEREWPCALLSV